MNGELALTLQNQCEALQRRGDHPDGNVTGMTMSTFLALPEDASVSVEYQGEADTQGFLSLKKL